MSERYKLKAIKQTQNHSSQNVRAHTKPNGG
jgi:hypothetical protein